MRFSLRTLLILLVLWPPVLALAVWMPAISIAAFLWSLLFAMALTKQPPRVTLLGLTATEWLIVVAIVGCIAFLLLPAIPEARA